MKATLLACLLALAAPAVATAPSDVTHDTADKENMAPLEFACAFLEVDCRGIERPSIIYTDLMGAMGLYGAYFHGENFVFVDFDAPAHTVVHEVTHYMLYEAGNVASRCVSEEAARRVHHAWSGTEYNDEWRKRYECELK